MKNILLVSSFLFVQSVSGISCIGLEQSRCKIKGFKYAGAYNNVFSERNVRDDYYYVYGFEKNRGCYSRVFSFLDSLEIDSTGDHMITFLKYDESLPDSAGHSDSDYLGSGRFQEAIIMKFSCDKWETGYRTHWYYYTDGQVDSSLTFENGELIGHYIHTE